uniref:Replication-associated protein n=1 Tax=Genomoviridae sp. TaxID=2202565 RepID=A0A858NG03_9VIRU|nr:MAG: replication-associated protein [Genomoviridae sp.]
MPFDFYARYGLFTYAQSSGLDPWDVSDHFTKLGAECIIGREDHADGGTHLHAFVDFELRRRFRQPRFADVSGSHPNIVSSYGTPWDGYDYAIKDGEVVAGGLERPGRPGTSLRRNDEIWSRIVGAQTREDFWILVRDLAPSALALSFNSLSKFADWQYAEAPYTYVGPMETDPRFDISQFPELSTWREGLASTVAGQRGGTSLVLWGDTRLGKSTWARSLGNHVYFGGLFSGKSAIELGREAEYAVFDDIRGGIKFFPGFKDWLGCQPCFMVKQLYREPVLFDWGKPSIWISNRDPREDMDQCDINWMEGNCTFVYLSSSIFHANTD